MISNTSNGFLSILGSLPIQFAMFLTILSSVKVPRNEEGEFDSASLKIYHLVWIMHLVTFVTLLLNHYYTDVLDVAKSTLNTCIMLFKVLVLI